MPNFSIVFYAANGAVLMEILCLEDRLSIFKFMPVLPDRDLEVLEKGICFMLAFLLLRRVILNIWAQFE